MPIRTNRGRVAVYRKLWGWPLRSPMHLVATVLSVALIAAVIALVLPHHPEAPTRQAQQIATQTDVPSPAPIVVGGDSTSSSEQTRLPSPIQPPSSVPPAPQALTVATQWASAWVKHPNGISNAQWLAGLKPYTTDEYLPTLQSVDPANIPATKVTGAPQPTKSYPDSVELLLPTDGPKLDITVQHTPSGWRVSDYTQAAS
ncbi:MAG: hypothetical protein J2O49_05440 [Sciscionella sp.]|nr:hypothetical protein [Sciscionella sp.]